MTNKSAENVWENTSEASLYPVALTIAGSDSGGGAGVQADLRTFSAFGVYGCSAITALTAQNPHGVAGIFPASPEFVALQIRKVLEDFEVKVIKTGMLYSGEIISAVTEALDGWTGSLVIDPVMVSTSGHSLLKEDARSILMERLFPRAAWITPNIPEAECICGMKIETDTDRYRAIRLCAERFGCGVVLKGGHFNGPQAEDLVLTGPGKEPYTISFDRLAIPSLTTHGTGCTFSAALAASLAVGDFPELAVRKAKQFVYDSLLSAVTPGKTIQSMFPKGFIR